jgi:hypothetical protein
MTAENEQRRTAAISELTVVIEAALLTWTRRR